MKNKTLSWLEKEQLQDEWRKWLCPLGTCTKRVGKNGKTCGGKIIETWTQDYDHGPIILQHECCQCLKVIYRRPLKEGD